MTLGWARRCANLSSPPSLTSLRRRVTHKKLGRLQHDFLENGRSLAKRMSRAEAVTRALDEPERAHSPRQRVKMLRRRAGHFLVPSPMNYQPWDSDLPRRTLDVELRFSVQLDVVQQIRLETHHLPGARIGYLSVPTPPPR